MYDTPEPYPGHIEDINMMEYETIKAIINEEYGTTSTALEIRSEFEIAFNKIFENMLLHHSHEVFKIIWVMVDEFNVSEEKILRYLNDENKEKVRNFAMNNYETYYYELKEEEQEKEKMLEKGRSYFKCVRTDDLFE